MKALIVNHPISCISKLHPHTITVKTYLVRPQPATPQFLRSQRPPNANVYLTTLPIYILSIYNLFCTQGQPCIGNMPLLYTMLVEVSTFHTQLLPYPQLLIVLSWNLMQYMLCLSFSKFMQIELTLIFFTCMHCKLYVQIYIPSPTYIWTHTAIHLCMHSNILFVPMRY